MSDEPTALTGVPPMPEVKPCEGSRMAMMEMVDWDPPFIIGCPFCGRLCRVGVDNKLAAHDRPL